MGTNYSSGPFPPKLLSVFKDLTLLRVRALMLKFAKLRRNQEDVVRRDYMFLSRDEVRRLLKLKIMQVYEVFRLLDHEHLGRVGVVDLWGCLALSCQSTPDEKVEFLFNIMDYTKSGYLSRTDLQTLMVCATRGLARIKGIRAPDVKILNKTINVIANMAFVNETGAISLRDVRVTMLMDENCKAYFAGLGSQIITIDSGMLVAQRRDILLDLAAVEAQIDEVAVRLNIKKEDKETYGTERGGDISALKISDMKAQVGNGGSEEKYEVAVKQEIVAGVPSDEQRLRRMLRARSLAAAQGAPSLTDAAVFVERGQDSEGGVGGSVDAEAIKKKWGTLPCGDDGTCELDVDIVEDLFEAAGIILTDPEAEDCLKAIKPNQLGRRRVEDVVEWYRVKLSTDVPVRSIPLWRKAANDIVESIKRSQQAVFQMAADLRAQRSLVDSLEEKSKTVAAMMNEGQSGNEINDTTSSSSMGVTMGETQGSQRLVAWQRQQLQGDPARLSWECSFGHPEEVPLPTSLLQDKEDEQTNPALKKSKLLSAAAKAQEKEREAARQAAIDEWERIKWKMLLQMDVSVTPPPTTIADRPLFFDVESLLMKDDVDAPDLLDVFKRRVQSSSDSPPVELPNGTVMWMSFTMKSGATDQDEALLIKLLVNFFESVPLDYRSNTYTGVAAKALRVATPTAANPDLCIRLVMLALTHQEDWFRVVEEQLPPGLLLSRSLRNASLHFRCLNSLQELYDASLPFETFEERLFGPQEDELGDEAMNPIRFAKLQRQRLAALQESIERAFRMPEEELRVHLRTRGLTVHGSHTDLANRARLAFKRQAQISGYGELSAFGADMCTKIYQKFLATRTSMSPEAAEKVKKAASTSKVNGKAVAQDKDKAKSSAATAMEGLSLWEMNDMLNATGTDTIYDRKEYKRIMEEQQLYVDKEGRLLSEGLTAYYEQFGRLASDIRTLGVGSLDEKVKGEMRLFAAYEPAGVASLLQLLEKHTILQQPLKIFSALLSSSREFSLESEFDSIAQLFRMADLDTQKAQQQAPGLDEDDSSASVRRMLEYFVSPGWISTAIHKAAEWLADEEDGVLRSLRKSVFDNFGKFNYWDEIYTDFFSSFRVPEHHFGDEIPAVDPIAYLSDRLDDILPPRSDIASASNSVNKAIAMRAMSVRISEMINDRSGTFRLSREERDEMMTLREKYEARAAEMLRQVEEEKQLCSAHAVALYDGMRRTVTGCRHLGVGTKDFTFRVKLVGLEFMRFMPKGMGEASVPRQISEDKLRRATQRKEAAFNALERERARKDKNNPDRIAQKQKKAAAALAKRKEEENRLFEEAFNALTVAREERKSATEIAAMARLWERLQQAKLSRYPNTLSSAVSQNNLACVLQEFYGPEHFKGKEVLRQMEEAQKVVVSAILALPPLNDLRRRAAEDGEGDGDGDDDNENDDDVTATPNEDSKLSLRRQGMAHLSDDEIAALSESKTIALEVPDEAIVPFLAILQNYLSGLRLASKSDRRHADTLEDLYYVRRMVTGLYGTLSMKEKDQVKKKLCKPLDGTPVFFMADVEAQIAQTVAEVKIDDEGGRDRDNNLEDDDDASQGSVAKKLASPAGSSPGGIRYKKRSTLAGGALGISKEDLAMEVAMKRAEREEKEAKMAEQRKQANALRAQTVRRRNRLYNLISSGEINRIFEMKAGGHVLAEGSNNLRWGTDEAVEDPLAFLDSEAGNESVEDSRTMTTFQSSLAESATTIGDEIRKKKKKKEKSVSYDDGASVGGDSLVSRGGLSFDGSIAEIADEGEPTSTQSKTPRGRLGLLSWLFRNRDR